MTHESDNSRRLNVSALRTLHALDRCLRTAANDLMQIDCEDCDAADAIRFAVDRISEAIDNTRNVRRDIHRGGEQPPTADED